MDKANWAVVPFRSFLFWDEHYIRFVRTKVKMLAVKILKGVNSSKEVFFNYLPAFLVENSLVEKSRKPV